MSKRAVADVEVYEVPAVVIDVVTRRTVGIIDCLHARAAAGIEQSFFEAVVRSAYLQGVADGYDVRTHEQREDRDDKPVR